MPKILSVLMPAHNAAKFLDESISSILNQSFRDFDFFILDDGSTDNSLAIIQKHAKKDYRVRVLENKTNQGEGACRNKLLLAANTPLVAWMDADDISLPHRLQTQLDFLKNNPDVDVVGCRVEFFDGMKNISKNPISNFSIKSSLLIVNPIAGPTVMLRPNKQKYPYNPKFRTSVDYVYWIENIANFKYHNLPKVLYKYRYNPDGLTASVKIPYEDHFSIVKDHLAKFSIFITKNEFLTMRGQNQKASVKELTKSSKIIKQILAIQDFYEYQSVAKNIILKTYYNHICRELGWNENLFFIRSFGVRNYFKVNIINLIDFIKCWFLISYFGIKHCFKIKVENLTTRYQLKNQK